MSINQNLVRYSRRVTVTRQCWPLFHNWQHVFDQNWPFVRPNIGSGRLISWVGKSCSMSTLASSSTVQWLLFNHQIPLWFFLVLKRGRLRRPSQKSVTQNIYLKCCFNFKSFETYSKTDFFFLKLELEKFCEPIISLALVRLKNSNIS